MKRILLGAMMAVAFCTGIAFAGGGQQGGQSGTQSSTASGKQINGGRPVTLVAMPMGDITENEIPTPEQPTVRVASRRIAEKFMQLHQNVTLEWDFSCPSGADVPRAEWLQTRIAGGTCPMIVYTDQLAYQARGWYLDLTGYLDTPNEYMPGNTRWKDMFIPDPFFNCTDANGRIVAIPFTMGPGALTALFLNKDAFAKLNIKYPANYTELLTAARTLRTGGYMSMLAQHRTFDGTDWSAQFIIDPPYVNAIFDELDFNKDGMLDEKEAVRGVKKNLFNPVIHEYMRECFQIKKQLYNEIYAPGWETADIASSWAEGKLGIKWDGYWSFVNEASNTQRPFDYEIIQVPLVDHVTSRFVKDIEWTTGGPYKPNGTGPNIMKPAADKDPGALEAAVAFFKFYSLPENISQVLLESGSNVSPVRGSAVPPVMVSWMSNPQPKISIGMNYMGEGRTTEYKAALDRTLEQWCKGQINDTTFFATYNDLQQKDADAFIQGMNLDTTGW
jgi:ABC-type glycerol-3-phosphate transport system substrate-binding protein